MTNRLADALSPYLRAHADNPVDWYPWGEEAFAEAERRDVPLLISIGYSTCHWCHVMARESFADAATAALINDGFVAVKVDREEHPDVDGAYMAAASAFTQNLGWPLTVFTTPRGRTFYAGTYWPPEARGPMPAFRDVLAAVREAWTERRVQAEESADAVADALARAAESTPSALPDAAALAAAAVGIAAREDRLHGGFGGAPKFPVATTLAFLRTPIVRRDAPDAAASASRALAAMAASDLRDADGGFFRYATQRDWTVPHYERMLTDNAQLLDIATGLGADEVAGGIAAFLLRTLRVDGGGFGAAQDSESWIDGERSEGGYYLRPPAEREGLEPPTVDGKVITGWNGLAVGALARAGARWGRGDWIDAAADAATHVLRVNRAADGRPIRASVRSEPSTAAATPADLALLADGLLALALATGDASWAVTGRGILDEALAGIGGDPVLAARGIAPAPDQVDGDLPSDAAALALAALDAWRLGAGDGYRQAAVDIAAEVAERALAQPFAHGTLLQVSAGLVDGPRQVVVVTTDRDGALADAARAVDADVVAVVTPAQTAAFAEAGFELFAGKQHTSELAYDCRAFVCRLPHDPATGGPAVRVVQCSLNRLPSARHPFYSCAITPFRSKDALTMTLPTRAGLDAVPAYRQGRSAPAGRAAAVERHQPVPRHERRGSPRRPGRTLSGRRGPRHGRGGVGRTRHPAHSRGGGSWRRGDVRLALVRGLPVARPHRRRDARRGAAERRARPRSRRDARGDHAAHPRDLRVQPEQPDRDRRVRRRTRALRRRGAARRARGDRRGLRALRPHRQPRRRHRAVPPAPARRRAAHVLEGLRARRAPHRLRDRPGRGRRESAQGRRAVRCDRPRPGRGARIAGGGGRARGAHRRCGRAAGAAGSAPDGCRVAGGAVAGELRVGAGGGADGRAGRTAAGGRGDRSGVPRRGGPHLIGQRRGHREGRRRADP
ncbi:hypothetical protein HA402_007645 [Bradysia odoriphaga]|nr:hypothetical protein HA402_007645 [Bradysia odoriphaga]